MNSSSLRPSPAPLRRIQIYLPKSQKTVLVAMAQQQSISSSALIREAIDVYIAQHQPASKIARRFSVAGAWQSNSDSPSLCQLRSEERKFLVLCA
jgi:hypothetical protein